MSHNSNDTIFSSSQGKVDISEIKEEGSTKNAQIEWENHPANARNWSTRRKWILLSVVLLYVLLPHIGAAILPPGLPEVAQRYRVKNPSVLGLTYSVQQLALAFGPLLLAPLSEMHGRKWVLHVCVCLSLVFNLASAFSPDISTLIVFRFLLGISASGPASIAHGIVGDLFSVEERMAPVTSLNIALNISDFFAPSLGGLITRSLGVKWLFITPAITFAAACVMGIPLLEDTYGPRIQQRRSKATVYPEAAINVPLRDYSQKSILSVLWVHMKRPLVFLCRSSICNIIGIYLAIISGIRSLLFMKFATIFRETYGFHVQASGFTYFGLGIGVLLSMFVSAKVGSYIYKESSERHGGKGTPEMRIPPAILGALFVAVGLLWFGWSAHARIHWIMPIIGMGIFGFGFIAISIPLDLYVVDVFHIYAASASAAIGVLRSLAEFVFPLFGAQMYEKLGLGGGTTLLGGLAFALGTSILLWLYYNGEELRAGSQFNRC